MLDLSRLNEPQRAAVEHRGGPLVVFAGAGSGKTTAITYRVAHLVEADEVPARRILAVTFTNKAANEMRERLRRLLSRDASDLWVGTFHATCARLLRRHAEACGVRKDFVIYDEIDQRAVIARVARDLGLDERIHPAKRLAWRINRAKQEGVGSAEFKPAGPRDQVTAKVYKEYEQRMEKAGALDFDDLLYRLVRAMRADEALRTELQQRWEQVLVDEFQDTNGVQLELVRELCRVHRNLCVVGDDDQSIYRWRGADYRNILDFQRHFPDARLIKLEQNYRSTKRILSVANAVVARNVNRQPKKLWTQNAEGQAVVLLCCGDEHDEADRFVQLVRDTTAEGGSRADVALLYRIHAQSRVFEEALRGANFPYRVVGGIRFYDRAEVKDLLAYLRLICNQDDDVSLLRIINNPPRGIGKTSVDRLLESAARAGSSVWRALLRAVDERAYGTAARKKMAGFAELVAGLRDKAAAGVGPADLIEAVLGETGYAAMLQAQDSAEADARLENIRELVGSIREFEANADSPTLEDFLQLVTLQTDQDRMQDEDVITLMTAHAAKGLEFPVVMVAGLEEGLFPHTRALQDQADLDSEEALQEERRLAYVAFTRAKQRLVLSYAKQRYLYGENRLCWRSCFIDEMPAAELRVIDESGEDEADAAVRHSWRYAGEPQTARGDRPVGLGRSRAARDSYIDRSEASEPGEDLGPGTRVSHPKFGLGQVLQVELGSPPRVTVRFAGGFSKTILASFLKPA